MKIGYARVSTRDQNLELQLDKLLLQVRPGDTVYIYKLDRLGRSLKHLLDLVADLQRRGLGLISLTHAINTASAQGRLVLNLFASLAESERELIRERTLAGLAAARARGRVGGRKPGLSEEAQRTARTAELLYKARELNVTTWPAACASARPRFTNTCTTAA